MADPHDTGILTVTTTVGSMDDAQRLAREIVGQRLAACVQLEPIALSVYRWQGTVCEGPEVRLSIKTLPRLRDALAACLGERHPYELPQIVAVVQQASAAYADWVRAEVTAA